MSGAAVPMLAHTHGQPATPTTVGKELANSPRRVRHRLSYLMERFSDRKPYWQYVIWLRQLLLTVFILLYTYVQYARTYEIVMGAAQGKITLFVIVLLFL